MFPKIPVESILLLVANFVLGARRGTGTFEFVHPGAWDFGGGSVPDDGVSSYGISHLIVDTGESDRIAEESLF